MIMDADEIRMRYRNAADPKKHVAILAQLNGCKVELIKDILFRKEDDEEMNSPADYVRVQELYNQGLPDSAIAKEVGLQSGSSIQRWRKNNGLPPNGYSRAGGEKLVTDTGQPVKPAGARSMKPTVEKPVKADKNATYDWQRRINALLETVSPDDSFRVREIYTILVTELFKKEVENLLATAMNKTDHCGEFSAGSCDNAAEVDL